MSSRLSTSRSVQSHSTCTLQQNANGRQWADRTPILELLTVRKRKKKGWMQDCSNPTCLSIHWGKTKAAPRKFNICFCLTTSPLNERRRFCGKVEQHGSKSAGLSQALQEDLTALCCNIHEANSMESQRQNQHLIHEQSPLPELDPQLFLNQGECDRPSHVAHQLLAAGLCWDSCGLHRSWPLTRFLLEELW